MNGAILGERELRESELVENWKQAWCPLRGKCFSLGYANENEDWNRWLTNGRFENEAFGVVGRRPRSVFTQIVSVLVVITTFLCCRIVPLGRSRVWNGRCCFVVAVEVKVKVEKYAGGEMDVLDIITKRESGRLYRLGNP